MKKRYLYLIFLSLSLSVALFVALIFKLQNPNESSISSIPLEEIENIEDFNELLRVQNYKDSWITKIKQDDQKDYFYAIEIYHLKL